MATSWRWDMAGFEEVTSSEIVDVFEVHDKYYNTLKRQTRNYKHSQYIYLWRSRRLKLFVQTRLFCWLISNESFHPQSQYIKYLTFKKQKSNFILQEEEHPLGAEFGEKRWITVSLHQLPGPRHLWDVPQVDRPELVINTKGKKTFRIKRETEQLQE